MDRELDDDDRRSLSERLLPLTSASYMNNNTSPRPTNNNRIRSSKPHKSISFDQTIYQDEPTLPATASSGDVVQMSDGTRKKYNGSSWRRLCSKANCTHYMQSQGLCKPHLVASKKRKVTKSDSQQAVIRQTATEPEDPKKGDIVVLANGVRKKYDGRQYRRICANSSCAVIVHGPLEHQNGCVYPRTIVGTRAVFRFVASLCPTHYNELRFGTVTHASPQAESKPLVDLPTAPKQSVISSSARKRHRVHSPASSNLSQVFMSEPTSKSSVPKPNRRLSIAVIPPTVDIENPNKGDLIEMENGSRKKFDGVVWRTICSLPGCLIAAQRNELCRKHFIKLNGKPNSAPTMATSERTSEPSSRSTADFHRAKQHRDLTPTEREESMDYDYAHLQEPASENASNSYPASGRSRIARVMMLDTIRMQMKRQT